MFCPCRRGFATSCTTNWVGCSISTAARQTKAQTSLNLLRAWPSLPRPARRPGRATRRAARPTPRPASGRGAAGLDIPRLTQTDVAVTASPKYPPPNFPFECVAVLKKVIGQERLFLPRERLGSHPSHAIQCRTTKQDDVNCRSLLPFLNRGFVFNTRTYCRA